MDETGRIINYATELVIEAHVQADALPLLQVTQLWDNIITYTLLIYFQNQDPNSFLQRWEEISIPGTTINQLKPMEMFGIALKSGDFTQVSGSTVIMGNTSQSIPISTCFRFYNVVQN